MRWIKFDTTVGGMFGREVCPEDSEYLLSHIDTFKCMWHEQTRNYWVRMVISLREYVKKHIFTYESLERLGAPVEIFEMLIEYAYINICTNFTQDSFGKAKDFLMAIINVTANKDMKNQIGTRPLSNDPFFNKFTRDSYRTVFGQPTSAIKMQLQVYISAPLYGRFAAGVVAILKQWVQAADCSLRDFYQKFHSNSYWPYPDDFCPQKIFFKFLEERCHGWESPDFEEVEQVMIQAPDRKTEFVDVVAILPSELMDYSGANVDDSGSEHSGDSDGEYGIKNWHDIMFAVSDHLIYHCPFHVEQLCATCMADVSDNSGDESDSVSVEDSCEDSDSDNAASEDYNFWHQPKVLSALHAAEQKYRERMLDKALEAHTDDSAANAPASSRKNRKSRKNSRVTLSINVLQLPSQRPQPVFFKAGAVPPKSKSQPEIINFEDDDEKASKISAALERLKLKIDTNGTPPAQQQPEKPRESASQERAKSHQPPQKAAPPKEAQAVDKKPLANGAVAASKMTQRKCANCSKSEGIKLKKCSLCVQQKMDPVYYCSRECQMEDWEEHQTVHTDDID
ncbi:uncharacterized protein LOC142557423 [Dermacentor variabilis]|uniref:uncharacterized protein LOC142557423 n=1 Tax=Dermacentor variabilis TaxID=34621 RepID=UPI003F5B0CBD